MQFAIFLDTMIYLHYRPVQEIDWSAVVGAGAADKLVIVVPGITLREIDNLKNQKPRLKERAQRVSEQLMRVLGQEARALRPGLDVEDFLASSSVDYQALGLDGTNNDDVLVGSILAYAKSRRDVVVSLVTHDSYPTLRARSFGIRVYKVPDDYKLVDAEDEVERENRELKQKLQRLELSRPIIDVEFETGGKLVEVELVRKRNLIDTEVAVALAEFEQQFPSGDTFRRRATVPKTLSIEKSVDVPPHTNPILPDTSRLHAMRTAIDSFTTLAFREQDIARYEEQRAEYLAKYPQCVTKQRLIERERARRIVLNLYLVNTGGAPASDIDVSLHIPDPFEVTSADLLTDIEMPRQPELPKKRMITADWGLDHLMMPTHYPHPIVEATRFATGRAAPRNVSELSIKKSNSHDVTFHVTQVKHGLRVAVPTLYLTAEEGRPVHSFQVEFSLHAANIPDAVQGVINVVVSER